MQRRTGTAIAAFMLAAGASVQAHAQARDSTPTLSVFGSKVVSATSGLSPGITRLSNAEIGGSFDFRLPSFPHTLRAGLAFREAEAPWTESPMRYGTFSLDLVGRPGPRVFGVQPYLLGGLGVATLSSYTARVMTGGTFESPAFSFREIPRHNWAFAEAGAGLDIGRHFFIQAKLMTPVASQGPTLAPLSVGFRFWD